MTQPASNSRGNGSRIGAGSDEPGEGSQILSEPPPQITQPSERRKLLGKDETKEKPERTWLKSPKQLLLTVLQLNDTPHHIALGGAIGVFLSLTPTVGVQMILVMLVAMFTRKLFYFNRVAALITIYISNPLTVVPIYYALYKVGALFRAGDASRDDFAGILDYDSLDSWWDAVVQLFVGIGEPLLIGSAIIATIGGILSYPIMYWLLIRFRRQHPVPVVTAPTGGGSKNPVEQSKNSGEDQE